MKLFFSILNWFFGVIFFMFLGLSLWAKHWLPALIILIAFLLVLPPIRHWIGQKTGIRIAAWIRGLLAPVLFFIFIFLILKNMGNQDSIYKTPETKTELMKIYDEKIAQWPVPFQTRDIQTQYGKVHVIISGPENAPALLLLHASAMSSWSWIYNVKPFNQFYRTYAIDTMGDAGKSELKDMNVYPENGEALAGFYQAIMDSLYIETASVIGASQGGFIATNLAIYAPDRIECLVPCGPMGYTGTDLTVLKIILTTLFPIAPLQADCFRWAFGDDSRVKQEVKDWFYLILNDVISRQAQPMPLTQDEFQSIQVPVLLLLGTKDGLVGNPDKTKQVVQSIPNVRVEVLETGHLIGLEKPDQFNQLVLDFLQEKSKAQ